MSTRSTKRVVDVTVAVVLLTALTPVLVVVALLVAVTSRGRVLFRQRRVGQDGRLFDIFKFRTMVQNAPKLGGTNTTTSDPRITAVGHVLRATKLDELPQILNVVRGEMSLVGPRPQVPDDVARYTEQQRLALSVPPGMTGLAQIRFCGLEKMLSNAADPDAYFYQEIFPRILTAELRYVRNWSLWLDFKIVLLTPVAILGSLLGWSPLWPQITLSTES